MAPKTALPPISGARIVTAGAFPKALAKAKKSRHAKLFENCVYVLDSVAAIDEALDQVQEPAYPKGFDKDADAVGLLIAGELGASDYRYFPFNTEAEIHAVCARASGPAPLTERFAHHDFQNVHDGVIGYCNLRFHSPAQGTLSDLAAFEIRSLAITDAPTDLDLSPLQTMKSLTELKVTFVPQAALSATALSTFKGSLPHLTKLELVIDTLDTLDFVGAFPGLEELVLEARQGALPETLSQLKARKLTVRGAWREGPSQFTVEALELPASLKELALVELGLTRPPRINARGLTSLTLCQNQLAELGDLEGLAALTYLNLDGNQLTSVAGVEKLGKLRQLCVSKNRINNLDALSQLKSLEALSLNRNELTEVPALPSLQRLEQLDMAKNQLKTLPSLAGFPALSRIDVKDNKLKKFEWLEELPKSCEVKLERNGIPGPKRSELVKRFGKGRELSV